MWHSAMAILSFVPNDQLFAVLVPELVVGVWGAVSFSSKPNFVQAFLSIKSDCVVLMTGPLPVNPPPKKRFVLLVTL